VSTTPFILSVDLDGVVFDYESAFRSFVARSRGCDEESLPTQTDWSFIDSGWGFSDEQDYLDHHAAAVSDAGLFLTMPSMPGVSEALWQLSDAGIHVRIVTARLTKKGTHAVAVADTVRALDIARIPYRDLLFTKDKDHALSGIAASAPGRVLHIDDSPGQLTTLQLAGVPTLIMDHAYNRHVAGRRVSSWDEVVPIVLGAAAGSEQAA
jgi:5'-nucleotidase